MCLNLQNITIFLLNFMMNTILYYLEEALVKPAAEEKMNTNDSKGTMKITKVNQSILFLANISVNSIIFKSTWHRRLGHPSSRVFYLITKRGNVTLKIESIEFCQSCQLGKSHSLPFSLSKSRATTSFDLIHPDV